MNMKGVSPVVATVLLIAIAVIAAVGVWYWVGAYTSKPATTGTDMKVIEITCAADSASLMVRNLGALSLPTAGVAFTVYNSTLGSIGTFNANTTASLSSGVATLVNTTRIVAGTYKATAAGYQDSTFNCV